MQRQCTRYIWAFSLVLVTVMVFASSASAVPNPVTSPLHPTLYVRCANQAGSFHSIQDAVNAAGGGYTIKVCEGTYYEQVNVNDATKTSPSTLDGLQILADEGVKLQCLSGAPPVRSGFDLHANDVTIAGFDISQCDSAISVEASYGGGRFSLNNIHNNQVGISFNRSSGYNSVVDNIIHDNSGDGVFDYTPGGDFISSNLIHENGTNGVEISSTIILVGIVVTKEICYSASALIVDNVVTDNKNDGVYLNYADCGQVQGNVLSENGSDGLQLNSSRNAQVIANDADKNGNDGIELNSGSTLNVLLDDRMEDNTAFDAGDHSSSPGNLWTNNHCVTTSGTAVCVP